MQENYRKLVIGCGLKKEPDAWNIDIVEGLGDQQVDIRSGLPFDDGIFGEVVADYILCQIQDLKFVLNEIWRVLEVGGMLRLKVPNAEFPRAFTDPMDIRYFTPETFDYFNKDHYRYQVFNYGFMPWKVITIEPISGGTSDIKDRLYVEMQK